MSPYPSVTYPSSGDNDENSDDDEDADPASSDEVEDGSYTATVDYYNPSTNYSATYTLSVEVMDGEVIQINFRMTVILMMIISPRHKLMKTGKHLSRVKTVRLMTSTSAFENDV